MAQAATEPAIALQLWTMRDLCQADFFGTLRRVAETGYRWIEPYDFYGANIGELARVMGDCGLGMMSSHVAIERLETELDRVMDEHEALGCRTIICPWLDEERRARPGVFESVGRFLGEIAPRLAECGFRVGYHNHDFEFTLAQNPDGLRRVLDQAPGVILAQLDTYWAQATGRDPAEYLETLAGRLVSVHLKDGFPARGEFTPTGSGEIDMPRVIAAARRLGAQSVVVEQDETQGDHWAAIRASLDFLRALGLS